MASENTRRRRVSFLTAEPGSLPARRRDVRIA
jgi:hypothetical protein